MTMRRMKNTCKNHQKRMKNTCKEHNTIRKKMKKMKKKTIKFIEKKKNKKNKTIKLKQRGGNPIGYIGWLFIRLFRLVFNIRSPPKITSIQGSLTSESSNRESTPPPETQRRFLEAFEKYYEDYTYEKPPSPDTKRRFLEAIEEYYKDYPFEQMWGDYKSDAMHFGRSGDQKSFNDTLDFFLKNPCKCVISLHGNMMDEFLSTKFGESTEGEKKKIMKILFDDNLDKIKYRQCSSANATPIIIFYQDSRIKNLVGEMNNGTYDKPILKYINSDKITLNDKNGLEEKVKMYLRAITSEKILDLSCTWKNATDFETQMGNIVVKIMFGTVVSNNETLHCNWSSEDRDEPIQLDE